MSLQRKNLKILLITDHLCNEIMKTDHTPWSKVELKTYILLLCAKADLVATEEEFNLIRSKTSAETFDKIYEEFCNDEEDECFEKIQNAVGKHKYSYKELSDLKKEIQEVFFSDNKFLLKEQNLGRVLDNILY